MVKAIGPSEVKLEVQRSDELICAPAILENAKPDAFIICGKNGGQISLLSPCDDPLEDVFPLQIYKKKSNQRQHHISDAPDLLYEIEQAIGHGVQGKVWTATCRRSSTRVAIKCVPILPVSDGTDRLSADAARPCAEEGVSVNALREVSLLKGLDHPHVVRLIECFSFSSDLCMVLEFMDMNLRTLLTHGRLQGEQLRTGMAQCLSGLSHCHRRMILHRDLKPENVLVEMQNGRPRFALADFGLARTYHVPHRVYSGHVVSLWYRPLEVLLGQAKYGPGLDIWSIACIFGEMAVGRPVFFGTCEIHQIFAICNVLGTPGEQVFPGVSALPHFSQNFPQWRNTDFAKVRARAGPRFGEKALDVLRMGLRFDPGERPLASAMLRMPYFTDKTED
ncbi:unnamed protein product [Effrenium voratum]|nr:unnamed protein product [Effrenium voratum]